MKKSSAFLIVVILLILGIFSSKGYASEISSTFTVTAHPSEYQVDKSKTYFDLSIPEKRKISLTVSVLNNSNTEITVAGEINQATTNLNGVVEYGKNEDQLSGKEPFDITKFASFEQDKVTIAPQKAVDFMINLSVPTVEYAGVVAGGITFKDITQKKEESEQSMFQNKFAYAIALIIHGNKEKEESEINLKGIKPSQINNRNILSTIIENNSSNYINKVSIDAKLMDKTGKIILEEQKENMQIAPDSLFKFPIYYKKEKMKPGTYDLKMKIKSDSQEWELSEKFVIHEETADELNKKNIKPMEEKKEIDFIKILLILNIVVLVIVFLRKI